MEQPAWDQQFFLAQRLHAEGRLAEAESLYRQVLLAVPDHVDSLHMLGVLAHQRGRTEEAIGLLQRATELRPDDARALYNFANVLKDAGRPAQAVEAYLRTVSSDPVHFRAYLGLGDALRTQGRVGDAVTAYRRAVAVRPDSAEAHNKLGVALATAGEITQAMEAYRRALAIQPYQFDALNNLAVAHGRIGDWDDALGAYARALEIRPESQDVRWNLALIHLLHGRFREGWEGYELRVRMPNFPNRTDLDRPLWDGSPLEGRRILIHAEQGFGDTIQFARFIPLVASMGGKVILQCQAELRALLQGQFPVEDVISTDEVPPPFDVNCPIPSLPHRLGIELHTIPARVPYLAANPAKVVRCESASRMLDRG